MTEAHTIRVLLVDDHTVVRSGLSAFFLAFDDLELVGQAAGGEEAIRLCEQLQPDVILMDLVMPGMDGATATRRIRERWPQIHVIALTSFPDEDLVHKAIQAGATSYLLKNIEPDELEEAIRAAAAGRPTLAPEATRALINAAGRPAPPGYDLTPREREILALMVQGLSNPEMAGKLDLSISTIKFHVSSVLAKLGVAGRTEAVSLALQHNLVE